MPADSGAALRQAWQNALAALGGSRDWGAFDEVLGALAQPHRHFHTIDHVCESLDELRRSTVLWRTAQSKALATLALILLDYVCIPTDSIARNKSRSASCARRLLRDCGLDGPAIEHVARVIVASATHEPSRDRVTQAVMDADLSILGSDSARYDRYLASLRLERLAIDDLTWWTERRAFVDFALQRRRLYLSPEFARLETQARTNLMRESVTLVSQSHETSHPRVARLA